MNTTKTDEAPDSEVEETGNAEAEDAEDQDDLDAEALEGEDTPEAEKGTPGVGQGAAAVVSAGLGVVFLTGSWVATVAAARETLVGQLGTSSTASIAQQVKEVYGDAWATTALVGGLFALAALIVGRSWSWSGPPSGPPASRRPPGSSRSPGPASRSA